MAQTKDEPSPQPQEPPTTDLARLRTYLNLPATTDLSPLAFLQTYFDLIPAPLTHIFTETTSPRERSRIRQVKARRMIWAGLGTGSQASRPAQLTAEEGWKRFPLLWERLGGDPLGPRERGTRVGEVGHRIQPLERAPHSSVRPTGRAGLFGAIEDEDEEGEEEEPVMSNIPIRPAPPTSSTATATATATWPLPAPAPPTEPDSLSRRARDEALWPSHSFMPGSTRSSVLQVNRLGGLMRDLEEEREALDLVEARRRERRDGFLDGGEPGEVAADQEGVVEMFERHLLELFLDGKDTIPYDEVDFTEPAGGNPLVEQDAQDDYFDDEDEYSYGQGEGTGEGLGDGEYDY